ncbi:MAG: hypothetical protein CVT88_09595 [Candidatus Altiarchaeales archaeon HGW-Altiarchaeales-1]|nr:MAG: hypothetical protein CVT88_09595 [Candidatus Altiarchaeales archaeon HGW-Altiarchaeales-1]
MATEYRLKGNDMNEIFKKILENSRNFLEVIQFYKSADDYASLILSNPNSTPEILFEEELNEVADEHISDNAHVICGNMDYGTERTIRYLLVFVNKILVAQLYGVEWSQRAESKLTVKFNKTAQFDSENLNDVSKKAVNLITEVIKEKTLFKE